MNIGIKWTKQYKDRKRISTSSFRKGRIRKILLIAAFCRPSGKAWKKKGTQYTNKKKRKRSVLAWNGYIHIPLTYIYETIKYGKTRTWSETTGYKRRYQPTLRIHWINCGPNTTIETLKYWNIFSKRILLFFFVQ